MLTDWTQGSGRAELEEPGEEALSRTTSGFARLLPEELEEVC
jgi:hypothetical protein